MFVETKFFHKAGEGSGGGGSDPHNLGYYADLTALQTAYPTGTDGDFAILGSTDTIWVWDSGTSAWKDTDTKGQVTSVNNQTGAVTLGINDVAPTQTGKSGYVLGTDGFVAGWVKPEIVQVSALPAASEDEVDNIYQFVGTTDANYTNGYFYKCVSDGQNPATYSWTQTDVQPAPSGLPDQTGNAGKVLTTDGTDASWSDKIKITDNESSVYLGTTGSNTWGHTVADSVVIGKNTKADSTGSIIIGSGAYSYGASAFDEIIIGTSSHSGTNAATNVIVCNNATTSNYANYTVIVGGYGNSVTVPYAMQFGGLRMTNSEQGTIKFATYYNNAWRNNKLLDADGTIPADRLPNAINKYSTMPTAASTNVGWIVQYTGATDATYTHGYIYECKAQGTDPETYAWTAVEVQAGGGGGLPSQTGNSGKFLTTDGTDASWATINALQNTATGTDSLTILGTATNQAWAVNLGAESRCQAGLSVAVGRRTKADAAGTVVIGAGSSATQSDAVAIGQTTNATGRYGIAIGSNTQVTQNNAIAIGVYSYATATNAIQLGANGTNSDANTFKVGNANGNFEMMNANGNLPADRLASTTGLADGNYRLRLTMASGVPTLSWVAE